MGRKFVMFLALATSLCAPGFAFAYGGNGGGGGDGGGGDTISEAPSLDGVISFGAGVDPQKWVIGAGHGMLLHKDISVGQTPDQDETEEKASTAAEFIGQLIVGEATGAYTSVYVDKVLDNIVEKYSEESSPGPASTPDTQKSSVSDAQESQEKSLYRQQEDKLDKEIKEAIKDGVISPHNFDKFLYMFLTKAPPWFGENGIKDPSEVGRFLILLTFDYYFEKKFQEENR